ncbi:MAG: hypothetical protein K8F51_04645, partial [Comamonas sp.]|nr:hypothetical protein [Comamonas sp.]
MEISCGCTVEQCHPDASPGDRRSSLANWNHYAPQSCDAQTLIRAARVAFARKMGKTLHNGGIASPTTRAARLGGVPFSMTASTPDTLHTSSLTSLKLLARGKV